MAVKGTCTASDAVQVPFMATDVVPDAAKVPFTATEQRRQRTETGSATGPRRLSRPFHST